ncbi:MAG: hypothetical protein WAK52_10710 [Trichococcus sp.]
MGVSFKDSEGNEIPFGAGKLGDITSIR